MLSPQLSILEGASKVVQSQSFYANLPICQVAKLQPCDSNRISSPSEGGLGTGKGRHRCLGCGGQLVLEGMCQKRTKFARFNSNDNNELPTECKRIGYFKKNANGF